MLKNGVTILDIGSSKVTLLLGERGVNRTYNIDAVEEREYEGYASGEFLDINSLNEAVENCFNSIDEPIRKKIKKVYVGVPGEFIRVHNRRQQITFSKPKKVNKKDIERLKQFTFSNLNETEWKLVRVSAVKYITDGGRQSAFPVGIKTSKLEGVLTGFTSSLYFIRVIKELLKDLNVKDVEFVPTQLAESLFLFSREQRDTTKILLDVGYISTTFSLCRGDGIIYQNSFSLGGGYISAYLMQEFSLPDIKDAEKLKRKVNLASKSTRYDIVVNNDILSFPSDKVHPIVTNVLDMIAESIIQCLSECSRMIPETTSEISLTGGGISYIRGARDLLVKRTDYSIEIAVPDIPYMNKPNETSKFALLSFALNDKINNRRLFFR